MKTLIAAVFFVMSANIASASHPERIICVSKIVKRTYTAEFGTVKPGDVFYTQEYCGAVFGIYTNAVLKKCAVGDLCRINGCIYGHGSNDWYSIDSVKKIHCIGRCSPSLVSFGGTEWETCIPGGNS